MKNESYIYRASYNFPSYMRLYISCLLVIMVLPLLHAQKYVVQEYNQFNQLPSDDVRAVMRDSIGFLWVGTSEGLYRFDGKSFQSYNNALKSLVIRDIIEVGPGKLWMSNDQGILEIHSQSSAVEIDLILPASEGRTDSLLYYPNELFRQQNGRIWIAQPDARIALWKEDKLSFYQLDDKFATGESECRFVFAESPEGELWMASESGHLFKFDLEKDQFVEQALPYAINYIGALLFSGEQLLIAGDGMYLLHPLSNRISYYYTDGKRVTSLMQDARGQLLMGTQKAGLFQFQLTVNRLQFQEVFKANDPHRINQIPYKNIRTIYQDGDENIWVAAESGLGLLQERFFATVNDMPNIDANWILHLENGTSYIQLDQSYKISKNQGEYDAVRSTFLDEYIVGNLCYNQGYLWAGCSDAKLRQFRSERLVRELDLSERGGGIFYLLSDQEDNIWICQPPTDKPLIGVAKLDKNGKIQEYGADKGLTDRILVLKQSKKGELYAAGIGKGTFLYRYDPRRDEFINLSLPFSFYVSETFEVHDFAIDEDGVVWLATTDGLIRYDLERYSKIDLGPLSDTEIRSILSFEGGHYWLSSDAYGLIYFDGEDYIPFDGTNGLPSKIMSYRGLFRDYEDHLWAATAEGMVYSAKANPLPSKSVAPIAKAIGVNGKAQLPDEEGRYHLLTNQKMKLEMVSLDFPGNTIEYRYRILNGKDSSWQYLKTQNEITLPKLPKGKLTIELAAKRGKGYQWSNGTELLLTLNRPWHKSVLARIVLALIVFALFWFLLIYRRTRAVAQIKKVEKALAETRKKYASGKKSVNQDEERLNAILQISQLSYQNIRGLALFKKLATILSQSFDLDIIELGIQDEQGTSLRLQGFLRQLNRYTLRNEELDHSSSLPSWTIHHQQILLINDLDKDWEKYLHEPGFDESFKSQVLVPFTSTSGEHLVLLVGAFDKKAFEQRDLQMFQVIASILRSMDLKWLQGS